MRHTITDPRLNSVAFLLFFLLSLATAYATYFRGYDIPNALFWDENYHIAAAQKYLNHVFFMEPHPPFGRFLIALGEALIKPNPHTSHFIGVDFIKDVPEDFSFAGFRFFPALFAWLTAPVFFLLFYEMTKSSFKAFLFSVPYLFDNAIIVHSRGAMFEGPQVFFVVLSLLFLFRLVRAPYSFFPYIILGSSMGAALAIKLNSLFLFSLPLIILYLGKVRYKRVIAPLGVSYLIALAVYLGSWQLHFNLGTKIEPTLPQSGFYDASEAYKVALKEGKDFGFFNALSEHLKFAKTYTGKVPKYDPAKADEKGSLPVFWPLGGTSINYRWEGTKETVQYLYLQCNPAAWYLALISVLIVSAFTLVETLSKTTLNVSTFSKTIVFAYWCYMLVVFNVDRVLYLYHYFVPLVLAYALIPESLNLIARINLIEITEKRRLSFLVIVSILIVGSFWFFKPFTYYEPLSAKEFRMRQIIGTWGLKCEYACT